MTRIEALLARASGENAGAHGIDAVDRVLRQEPLVLQSSPIKQRSLSTGIIPPMKAGRVTNDAGQYGGAGGGSDRSEAVVAPSIASSDPPVYRMGSSALDFYGGGGGRTADRYGRGGEGGTRQPLPPPNSSISGSVTYGIPGGVRPGAPRAFVPGSASPDLLQF